MTADNRLNPMGLKRPSIMKSNESTDTSMVIDTTRGGSVSRRLRNISVNKICMGNIKELPFPRDYGIKDIRVASTMFRDRYGQTWCPNRASLGQKIKLPSPMD